ncbi:MFS transporter [Selenomonas sp. TAMA-11512]|uniref:MFS transporter n=1 Tax=Selenomonas sp. TAMA-11512 TaxID=3095337 RepID=UPI0030D4DB74
MNWKLVLAVLVCNVLFMSSSYTMLIPFLPLYLTKELGVSAEDVNIWSGLVFSASFIVSAIMAPIWGRIADRYGKRLMALRASFLLSISYMLCGLVQSPEQLVIARLIQGFSSGLWPMDLAIMTLYAPQNKVGISLGILQGVLTAGGVIGPLLGGILAESFGMRLSFFIGAGGLFFNFLIFLFIIKEPPQSDASKKTAKPSSYDTLIKLPLIRNLLIAALIVSMVVMILQPIITTYVSQLDNTIENIILVAGFVFSLGGIAGAVAAPVWGIIGQKFGFIRAILASLCFAALVMIVQGFQTNLFSFAVCQFLGGLFFSGIHPSINALLAKHTPDNAKGSIFGLQYSFQQIGSIVGPLIGGLVATYLGMHYVFYLSGMIFLLLALFVYRHFRSLHAIKSTLAR